MKRNHIKLSINNDITTHAEHAFNTIYQFNYGSNTVSGNDEIARENHGIQHVTRAAIYAMAFINLYRLYGDEEAKNLTHEDVKLLQIAMLYHDSARLNDGEDLWDKESATILYKYLVNDLNIKHDKAKLLAEAIANKDCLAFETNINDYFELTIKNGEIIWNKSVDSNSFKKRNIFQKIIHDADCLDIQRVRERFNQEYLDFYQEYAKDNNKLFDLMTLLVMETNRFIEAQGDSFHAELRNNEIKKRYEHAYAYESIVKILKEEDFPLLFKLTQQSILLSNDTLESLSFIFDDKEHQYSAKNLNYLRENNKLFFRGIRVPTGIWHNSAKVNKEYELASDTEIRKTKRLPHIPTRTKKLRDGKPTI